ncbi:MAG: hypothetical protein MUC61_01075 [Amoebophilaceae bacterium]|nr:hypothetical protein [Amoebophilaceae bacterium]
MPEQEDPTQSITLAIQEKHFEAAWKIVENDPTKINAVQVCVDGDHLSLLHAALLLHKDFDTIKRILDKGADVKVADQGGFGILHALVRNSRLGDQEKASLVEQFFDLVGSADDIKTNQTHYERQSFRFPTPWLYALGHLMPQTARKIVEKMSFKQANKDGLYHAVYHLDCPRDLCYPLVDKEDRDVEECVWLLSNRVSFGDKQTLPAEVVACIKEYAKCGINVHQEADHMSLWVYAWRVRYDVELALHIIRQMPFSLAPMSCEDIAVQANAALRGERVLNGNSSEIEAEWLRIRETLISIGVRASQLDD